MGWLLSLAAFSLILLSQLCSYCYCGFSSRALNTSGTAASCELQFPKQNLPLDVFWINLDKSIGRRAFMIAQLKYYGLANNHRFRALVPEQLITRFTSRADEDGCLSQSEDVTSKQMKEYTPRNRTKLVFLQAVCGRPRNTLRELIVTFSHIFAIQHASQHHNKPIPGEIDLSQYALILEDDLFFAFEVDFRALLLAAPKDFTVIQLVTSNDYSVLNLWRVFERHKQLFIRRKPHDDYWCAGAYLIHKARLANATSTLLYKDAKYPYYHGRMMTGYDKPCHPAACCRDGRFTLAPGCIRAGRGYAADNVIFTLSEDTYMLTVPIMQSSEVGNVSTLHQKHVSFHQPAFHRMKEYTEQMTKSSNPLLRFINPRCRFNYTQEAVPVPVPVSGGGV